MEYYFDLGVQHQITISGNNKLELRADIFNIFNAENVATVIMPHKVTKFKVGLVVIVYTKKCIATETVSVWSSLFILIKPISR
jgi:hypothetical protein